MNLNFIKKRDKYIYSFVIKKKKTVKLCKSGIFFSFFDY
jgi:hypothetical protein